DFGVGNRRDIFITYRIGRSTGAGGRESRLRTIVEIFQNRRILGAVSIDQSLNGLWTQIPELSVGFLITKTLEPFNLSSVEPGHGGGGLARHFAEFREH